MSLPLTLGGQKAKKFKKTNWDMFYGTPCTIKTEFKILKIYRVMNDFKKNWKF